MIAGSAALDLVQHLNAPGSGNLLTFTVKVPATSHELVNSERRNVMVGTVKKSNAAITSR